MTYLYPVFAILLLWVAAYTDLTGRVIRNWISISLLLLFVLPAFLGGRSVDLIGHLTGAGAVFAVFFAGFALGKVGGGDVKLATVTMLWAGPEGGLEFLLVMAVSGGFLALALIVPMTRMVWEWTFMQLGKSLAVNEDTDQQSVPYGVAIAIGGTVALYHNYLATA
jgi:prepilin peptidase CpaA